MLDLTEITWTIDPTGGRTSSKLKIFKRKIIGPVVPAMVATSTDPSIPSNEPVPPMIVPEKGGGRGGASNVAGILLSLNPALPLFKTIPFPELKTKAVPEYIYYIFKFKKQHQTNKATMSIC